MSQPPTKPTDISAIVSWLKLIRVPNLATAIADPLAGFLIAGGFYQYENLPLGGWLAIASSLCLYAGGMVQNDVVDLQIDQTERPHRPLPSKRVSFELAQVVSIGLLLSGVVLACVASVSMRDGTPAVIGVMLTAAICGYNCYAKGTWLGPLFMGGCRALNWSLGMVMAKPISKKIGGFAFTAWVCLFAGPMLLLGSFIFDGNTITYFKNASLKIFVKVSEKIRAKRRHKQLNDIGEKSIYAKILKEIKLRDKKDKSRKNSPLVIPKGAKIIDNSQSFKKTIEQIRQIIERIN